MDSSSAPLTWRQVAEIAARQHDVIPHRQLVELGLAPYQIRHRVQRARLHRIYRGVYAFGRPGLTREGEWLAAVYACGDGAAISHAPAGALWGMWERSVPIEVSIPRRRSARHPGIVVHRRSLEPDEITERCAVPVTTPMRTLIDLAARLRDGRIEAMVNEADRLDLIDPVALRCGLDTVRPGPGVGVLRRLLDRRTLTVTDSELERRFLPIAAPAGLGAPLSQVMLSGFRVDFFWPDVGLVVETDGLRYHRTPGQQARDRRRDQAHTAAGLTPLRFTHAQIAHEPGEVERVLRRVASLLAGR
jgi:hypothetical protein